MSSPKERMFGSKVDLTKIVEEENPTRRNEREIASERKIGEITTRTERKKEAVKENGALIYFQSISYLLMSTRN